MAILDLGKVKFLWKGNWATATSYEKDDVVVHNGSVWICKQTHSASVSGEGLNRLAPGKRFRQSGYGVSFDPQKPPVIYNVTKIGGKFYLNGRLNPNITFEKGHTYRFYVYSSTMTGVNFRFATATDGTTYTTGVTTSGTPGIAGSYVQITVPLNAPSLLYYKQDGTAGVADTASITVSPIWQGWQYWDELSNGFKWTGVWSNATQYYAGQVVSYDGNLYIADADNVGEIPDIVQASRTSTFIDWTGQQTTQRNNHVWSLLSGNQVKRRKDNAMWMPNQGPINWPYLHNDDTEPAVYRKSFYISSTGRVYGLGWGTASNQGYNSSGTGNSFWTEVNFRWYDWYDSLDAQNPDGGSQPRKEEDFNAANGHNTMYNRSGKPPKCIQIEMTHSSTYFLFDNGELWGIGHNGQGQKGVGATGNRNRPTRVMNLHDRKIIKISASKGNESSAHHLIALDSEGDVWTWGYNAYGQLGHGHSRDVYSPRRIPREWLGGEEIIDVLAAGMEYGSTYVRTRSNNIYSWGYNGYGQLGQGDTTDRWIPGRMTAFNPVTNGGIRKFAAVGQGSLCSFHLLDGNGYMWHTGYNGYGTAINGSTTNNNTIARSTVSPTAAATVNFWTSAPANYNMLWMRITNGNTYFVGYNGSNYIGGIGNNTTPITSPTLVFNVTNPKRIFARATHTTNIRVYWLTDRGEMWFQGYTNYSSHGNEYGGSGSNVQDGTNFRPVRMAIPSGTKIIDMFISCADESTNYAGSSNYFLCDNGQVYGNGFSGRANELNNFMMGHHYNGGWNSGVLYPWEVTRGYAI
jgi:hypothetical protein